MLAEAFRPPTAARRTAAARSLKGLGAQPLSSFASETCLFNVHSSCARSSRTANTGNHVQQSKRRAILVKGCKVRALDHANPCEGLQSAPHNVSLYLAFVRSTLPIPAGCKLRRILCHFTSRSCVRPCQSL